MASVHGAGWVGGGVVESHDTAAVLIGVLYKKNFVLAGCNFWWINLNQQKMRVVWRTPKVKTEVVRYVY